MAGLVRSLHGPSFYEPVLLALSDPADTDGVTTITRSDGGHIVVTGDAINHRLHIADSTTLVYPGRPWMLQVTNAGSEFIGVHSYSATGTGGDSAAWQRIPPRGVATFVLTAAGTAAGTWVSGYVGPGGGAGWYEATEQFIDATNLFTATAVGPAASASQANIPTADDFGNMRLYPGTDAAGYALIRGIAIASDLTVGPQMIEATVNNKAVATAGEDYVLRVGWGDATTGAAFTDGVWLEMARARNATTSWWRCSINGGVETATDSLIASTISTQALRVECARAANRADYWVGRVYAGAVTTNLPAADAYCGKYLGCTGVATGGGAAARLTYIGRVSEGFYPADLNL